MSSFFSAIFGSSPAPARRRLKRRASRELPRSGKAARSAGFTAEEYMSSPYGTSGKRGGRAKLSGSEDEEDEDQSVEIGEDYMGEEYTEEGYGEEIGKEYVYEDEPNTSTDNFKDDDCVSEGKIVRTISAAPRNKSTVSGKSLLSPIAGTPRSSAEMQTRAEAAAERIAMAKATYTRLRDMLEAMPPGAVADRLQVNLRELKDRLDRTTKVVTTPPMSEKARGKLPVPSSSTKDRGFVPAKFHSKEMRGTQYSDNSPDWSLGESDDSIVVQQLPKTTSEPVNTEVVAKAKATATMQHPLPRAPGIPLPVATTITTRTDQTKDLSQPRGPIKPLPQSRRNIPLPQTRRKIPLPAIPPPTTPKSPSTKSNPKTQASKPSHRTAAPGRLNPTTQTPTAPPRFSQRPPSTAPPANHRTIATPSQSLASILSTLRRATARKSIPSRLSAPHYTTTDIEIRDSLWQIMDLMQRFSRQYFSGHVALPLGTNDSIPPAAYAKMSMETARVIGCVASGGPGGAAGWHELFVEEGKRKAVVCAVVGNVLVEQVFGHGFFGGREGDVQGVAELQGELREFDGFVRNTRYAEYIATALDDINTTAASDLDYALPANFNNHVIRVVLGLWTHLKPIFQLLYNHPDTMQIPSGIFNDLYKIVAQAGLLSLLMRLDKHTVYYFEPIFKEDTYSPARMECINHAEMRERNPTTPLDKLSEAEQERRAGLSDAEKQRARGDGALTQITIMSGLCAYRLGGWETRGSTADQVEFEDPAYETEGIRVRSLTHGWVYCRWGRPRGYNNGKVSVAVNERIHGDAWEGGFLEFTDVEGVPNWSEKDRRETKAKAAAMNKGKAKGKAVMV
ncbi:hypothetical protein T440DRAFT_444636 [Plenodomus tracheiphilus IPT5]|uniref:Uncharacterized protein n=1 Tax=Plenodomus tracheiphilus IPT5 TaxID=1408161 RepID=A0A6A7BDL8_9PLEO|nr:hypothetical protein T440DRAFT_444636 [Plenodomus tracheiphilus IPT5]